MIQQLEDAMPVAELRLVKNVFLPTFSYVCRKMNFPRLEVMQLMDHAQRLLQSEPEKINAGVQTMLSRIKPMSVDLFERYWLNISEDLEVLFDNQKAVRLSWKGKNSVFAENQVKKAKEMTIALVGLPGNGQTSLMNAATGKEFTDKTVPTFGANYRLLESQTKSGIDTRCFIWDCKLADPTKPLSIQHIISDAECVLFVFDLSKEDGVAEIKDYI
jgi:Ras-related protein Rab-5C